MADTQWECDPIIGVALQTALIDGVKMAILRSVTRPHRWQWGIDGRIGMAGSPKNTACEAQIACERYVKILHPARKVTNG